VAVQDAAPPIPAQFATQTLALQNDANQRLAEVLTKFGDGLPYATDRYEDKIRNHLSRSADEMLAAGRALIVVREHVPHGEWGEFLERLRLEESLARRMCQAAVKFSNRALTHDLVKAAGNKTKLFELMVLDDEDIQELSDGGTVAGLNLDKVARSSTAELRKQVRELLAEREATQKLIDGKNQKMDRLEAELQKALKPASLAHLPELPPPDETRQELCAAATGAAHGIEQDVRLTLHAAIAELLAHGEKHGTNGGRNGGLALAAACVMQVQQALNEVRDEFQLPAFQDYVPRWLPDGDATDAPFVPTGGDVNLADLAVDPPVKENV